MAPTALIIGGGLAGVACAQRLADGGVEVVLLDRNDYLQFQPLLYQVASSQLPAEDIARPLGTVFDREAPVTVVQAEVTAVSFADRSAKTADGRAFRADHLVLATGSEPNFFGVPGAAEHAFPMYSVADAERLRLQLRTVLANASDKTPETDPDNASVDIVVVGGGPTGAETSGAIAELVEALTVEDQLSGTVRVHLVDRGQSLLPQFSDKAHGYAMAKLTERGVNVRLGTGVARVDKDVVHFDEGSPVSTRTLIWAGGSSGERVSQHAGHAPGRGGRVDVAADLSVDGFPGVHAIGDAANIPAADGSVLPQLGSVAQQSGRQVADNILREIAGKAPKEFQYKDKGIMAMIGRNAAVAEVGKHRHQVEGPIAFAAWLGVHAMLLSGVHSRADAFLSWAWDYFDRDHAATIESQSAPHRIAWDDDEADVPHIELNRSNPGVSPGSR